MYKTKQYAARRIIAATARFARSRGKKFKKERKKESKYWAKEDEILLTHIPYKGDSTKSPHILINKWFHQF